MPASTAAVDLNIQMSSYRGWATGFLSTNTDGVTGSDTIDLGGNCLSAIALSTLVSASCTYQVNGGLSSTACQPLILSSGSTTFQFGSTAAVMQGRTFVFDPAYFAGIRFIQLQSMTTGAAAPNATGATYQVFGVPYGTVK